MKRIFLLLLASSLLAGCASIGENKKQQGLEEATLFYEKAIRWGDFTAASRFQHTETGSSQPVRNLDKIKVTSYRQVNSRTLEDDSKVIISVQIDYYHSDSMKLITLSDEQVWKYEADKSAWYITTPLPDFR